MGEHGTAKEHGVGLFPERAYNCSSSTPSTAGVAKHTQRISRPEYVQIRVQQDPGQVPTTVYLTTRLPRHNASLLTATLNSKTRTVLVASNLDCTSSVLGDAAFLISGVLTVYDSHERKEHSATHLVARF
jgi:hypothetical protein